MVLSKQERDRLPATLKRSPSKAQATYMHTLEAAEETHSDGEAAHRIAFGSLKHSFEKVGDHWEPKDEKGPSDDQDAKRGPSALRSTAKTAGGVNAYATKAHLMEIARRLNVTGRSTMTKAELVAAVDKANRTATATSNRKARTRPATSP
jgi:ChaB